MEILLHGVAALRFHVRDCNAVLLLLCLLLFYYGLSLAGHLAGSSVLAASVFVCFTEQNFAEEVPQEIERTAEWGAPEAAAAPVESGYAAAPEAEWSGEQQAAQWNNAPGAWP